MRKPFTYSTLLFFLKQAWQDKLIIIASTLFILSPNWLSDAIKGDSGLLETLGMVYAPLGTHRIYAICISTFILLASAILLYNILPGSTPIRSLSPAKLPYPRHVLILPVSTPTRGFQLMENPIRILFDNEQQGSPKTIELTGDLDRDIEQLPLKSNTQHLLRALRPHCKTVEHIMLIGSTIQHHSNGNSINTGSQAHLKTIEKLLKMYCSPTALSITLPNGIDFEDVDALYKTFCHCIKQAHEELHYAEHQMIIDATGGLKTTSIAASLATLHNHVAFQYVQSAEPFQVKSYDLLIDHHPHFQV